MSVTISPRLSRTATVAAVLAAAGTAVPASAQDLSFTAGATAVSDYLFRGISQTNGRSALQGNVEAALGTGVADTSVYAGLFASNVKFVVEGVNGTFASREFDYTGGIRGRVGDLTWDVGFVYYDYDRRNGGLNYDFHEYQGKVGYDFGVVALTAQLNHTPRFQTDSKTATYAALTATVPLPFKVTAFGRIGKQWIDNNANYGTPDYVEYQIGVQRELFLGVVAAVSFNDTNISKADLRRINSGVPYNNVDPSVVFALTRSFAF